MICSNPRIRNVDLTPFVPLPPLAVQLVYALPGKIMQFVDVPPGDLLGTVRLLSRLGEIK